MKKILLTESQLAKVTNVIKENVSDDRYSNKVRVSVWTHGDAIKYNGNEISDFTAPEIEVSFRIYEERRQWGIKHLEIVDIRGPESIEIEVDYYSGEDQIDDAIINIPLDWGKNLVTDINTGTGILSIAPQLDIELVRGESGKIVAKMQLEIDSF